MGLRESRSCCYLEAALFLRINCFHIPCSSLKLFCWIYLVQGLGVGVIKDPLHFVLLFPESSREPYNPALPTIRNWTAHISIPNFCSIKFISISTSSNWFFFLTFFLPCFVYTWESLYVDSGSDLYSPSLSCSGGAGTTAIHAHTSPVRTSAALAHWSLYNLPGMW